MECRQASYLTEIRGLLLAFGSLYRHLWGLSCGWVMHIILRLMDNLSRRSSPWRIYYGLVCLIIWKVRVRCFHWWNLPTTTTITLVLVWRHMRPCMDDDAELRYVGIRMVSCWCWVQSSYNRLLRKSRPFRREWTQLRVGKSPTEIKGGGLWS